MRSNKRMMKVSSLFKHSCVVAGCGVPTRELDDSEDVAPVRLVRRVDHLVGVRAPGSAIQTTMRRSGIGRAPSRGAGRKYVSRVCEDGCNRALPNVNSNGPVRTYNGGSFDPIDQARCHTIRAVYFEIACPKPQHKSHSPTISTIRMCEP